MEDPYLYQILFDTIPKYNPRLYKTDKGVPVYLHLILSLNSHHYKLRLTYKVLTRKDLNQKHQFPIFTVQPFIMESKL